MATNSRKHRLRLYRPNAKSLSHDALDVILNDTLAQSRRNLAWMELYFRVGGNRRDDPQLMKMLWRSKKHRNIQKHLAEKRK